MKRQIAILMCLVAIAAARCLGSTDSPNLTELQSGWRMTSATNISVGDAQVSLPALDVSKWYNVQRIPATVLQILEDNGVYKNLYYGTNLSTPKHLWKQDWWYRTTFTAPAGREVYSLVFKGINYRAEIWLNGHKVATHSQAVGMYNEFEFNVTGSFCPELPMCWPSK